MTGQGGTTTPSGAILNADGSITQPTTPVATTPPATPAPTETVTTTETPRATTKMAGSTPVIDYNVSTGREQEIQDNISKITQTNPNLLKDRNAYNQAFGYDTADQGKKALLDSTFNGQVKPNADQIFTSLKQ